MTTDTDADNDVYTDADVTDVTDVDVAAASFKSHRLTWIGQNRPFRFFV